MAEVRRFSSIWAQIDELPERSFVRVEDLAGVSRIANQISLEEATTMGKLIRVRRGLYWKGVHTRYGMVEPSVHEIVREVLGDQGVGPSGYSAARMLGLTTQIPAVYEVALIGPTKVIGGTVQHRRANVMRGMLNELEIAVLEVLRAPDVYSERGWEALVAAIQERIGTGAIRKAWLLEVAAAENHKPTRTNALRLEADLRSNPRPGGIVLPDGEEG